ncbi:hypothetical protein [Xanthomonas arboricola]|uniref:hypothetical protein n=1 Tax=Xanthomonas arboricola TaxID=56448 RepID=UPI0011B0E70F|nr:hypothetical protein [Xanthomonas arboricola]
MRVLVTLLSQHRLLIKTMAKDGQALLDGVDLASLVSEQASLVVRAFQGNDQAVENFEEFLLEELAQVGASGLVVLFEEQFSHLIANVRCAAFAASIPRVNYVENVANFLTGHFRPLLRNFGDFLQITSGATDHQAIALPLKNFNSRSFGELLEYCRIGTLGANFRNDLVVKLNRVLRLRGPKRRSAYPHVYFVDEGSRYFKYGFERHSKPETGGNHKIYCQLNAGFRFGKVLENERHYNVTVGDSDNRTPITCNLPNCHSESVPIKARSHINMFSSDYHK